MTSPSGTRSFQAIRILINDAAKFPPAESPKNTIFFGYTLYTCLKQYKIQIYASKQSYKLSGYGC